jgi:hypothetical protein
MIIIFVWYLLACGVASQATFEKEQWRADHSAQSKQTPEL